MPTSTSQGHSTVPLSLRGLRFTCFLSAPDSGDWFLIVQIAPLMSSLKELFADDQPKINPSQPSNYLSFSDTNSPKTSFTFIIISLPWP